MLALCKALRTRFSIAAVTNDIFTREDCEFLTRNNALPADRIVAVETGGCPHAAVREDISTNLLTLTQLHHKFDTDLLLIESGGDNLAANYSRELADFIIYVIDVSGGDKIPRKGGPGRRSRSGACSGRPARNACWRLSVPQTPQTRVPGLGEADDAGLGSAIATKLVSLDDLAKRLP